MSLPPIVTATMQSAVIGAVANVLAQAIAAYQNKTSFVIDWVPVFQFFVFAVVSTPPNILWQMFLEDTFPAHDPPPTKSTKSKQPASEPKLNIQHTVTKTLLDQTVGAAINTLLFSIFMSGLQAAMAHQPATSTPAITGNDSLDFLLSGRAVDYGVVDWAAVWAKSRAEFWGIVKAGWTFWPFVSVVNFAFVKGVEARNLVGSLAGVAWGVYMSMVAAGGV